MSTKNNPFEFFQHTHKWVFAGFNTKSVTQKPVYVCVICGKKK